MNHYMYPKTLISAKAKKINCVTTGFFTWPPLQYDSTEGYQVTKSVQKSRQSDEASC